MEHFITSLRDEVRVLKELPSRLKQRVELGMTYTMAPVSWSDISYYYNQVSSLLSFLLLALLQKLPELALLEVQTNGVSPGMHNVFGIHHPSV